MTGNWSIAWGVALALTQLISVPLIAMLVRVWYRSEASALLRTEPQPVPAVSNDSLRRSLPVEVVPPVSIASRARLMVRRVFQAVAFGTLYGVAGLSTLYAVTVLFGPSRAQPTEWVGEAVLICTVLAFILIIGRLGLAASGTWLFSSFMGLAIGNTLFAWVWLFVFGILPEFRGGVRGLLTILLGVPFVWFLSVLALGVVYFVARGALLLHQVVATRLPVSPTFVVVGFFWFVAGRFSAPDGMEWYASLLYFQALPLAGYLVLTLLVLGALKPLLAAHRPARLLYLRSFAQGSQSERLFRRLAAAWATIGPVRALSGPDIVAATLDSTSLAALLRRDLESVFVASPDELSVRVEALRDRRYWDLSYAVEEVKCRGPIWTSAFELLLAECDVVLLDLRGFHRGYTGTAHELSCVVRSNALDRTVILCDDRTSLETVADVANAVAAGGPAERVILTKVRGGAFRVARVAVHLLLRLPNAASTRVSRPGS